MPKVPANIGPYEVIRPIAQGGMAEVFEVVDPDSGERRALKLLMELKTSVKRFNREFEALTRLNHPSIVRVYRYGFHESHPWISMELLQGVQLQSRVKDFGAPGTTERTQEVLRIAYFLANALQYIHDRGLVHRDLKSANVQVLKDGRVKLLDFGTAHLVDPLERITQDGDFVGTFSYAAPEQIVGSKIDHRADLYALGVLLYRMLTGRRPFAANDPHKVAHMHLHVEPRPMREGTPELPQALDDLVLKLLAKQRKDRPQGADEVASELERIAGRALSLPGLGIAISEDRSFGRAREHRALWQRLGEGEAGRVAVIYGGDVDERRRFLLQVGQDAQKRGQLAIVVRPAGEPATHLARALSAWIQGDDDQAGVLRELLQGADGSSRATLVESMRRVIPDLVARLVMQETETVLGVEEAPHCDAAALDLIALLVKEAVSRGAKLSVVVTTERLRADGVDAVTSVASEVTNIRMNPLDTRGTAIAVGHLLHRRPAPPEAARRIQQATGGHPSLIEIAVRDMVAAGLLTVRDDDVNRVEWPPEEQISTDVNRGAHDTLDTRLAAVPVAWRSVLEVLDVLGGSAHRADLASALGQTEAQVESVVSDMLDEDLLMVPDGDPDMVKGVDTLLIRYVGASTSPLRRAAIEHVVADFVERMPPSERNVRLLLDVGRSSSAVERGVRVARELVAHGEPAQAAELLEALRAHADHPGLPATVRIEFHLLFSEAVHRVKPMDARAVRALEAAEKLANDDAWRARVRLGQAEQQRAIGHYSNHRRFLMDAWELLEHSEERKLKARVALELGHSHVYGAQIPQARTWYDNALEGANQVADREVIELARVGLATMSLAQGNVEEAEVIFEEISHTRASDSHAPDARWLAVAGWGQALRRQGRFSEAFPMLQAALAEARDAQAITSWSALAFTAASCELDLMRLGRAQEIIEELAAALGPGERLHLRLETRLFQGRVGLASGQPVAASFLLEETVGQAEKAGLVLIAETARALLASARWALGMEEEGRGLYQKALLGLMSTGDALSLSDAVVARARALGSSEDPTKAFKLVRRLLSRSALQPLYVESLMSELRWHTAHNEATLARQSLREVQSALNRMASKQSLIEQATLRVHPWAHEMLRASESLPAVPASPQG